MRDTFVISPTIPLIVLLLVLLLGCNSPAPDTGGPLPDEQAAYDVTFYDLNVEVEPDAQRIDGRVTAHATATDRLDQFVLNLDHRLAVDSVRWTADGASERLDFERRDDDSQLWIDLPAPVDSSDALQVEVSYGGEPRVAPNPPWDGGFTWDETEEGEPWIGTSCQTIGADIWWPVKDHPGDKPDSVAINTTIPDHLTVASNGRLRGVEHLEDGQKEYQWFVSTPINEYNVALNIAPYEIIETSYESVSGDTVDASLWVLPEERERAEAALPEFLDQLAFLEETLGPFPFRQEKYGVAHTPFAGMEHQTILAHGGPFGGTDIFGYDAGFDALHLHELAHEWFGNFVTVRDWKDFWIHESSASYIEALYAEKVQGTRGYRTVIDYFQRRTSHGEPIARQTPTPALDMYHSDIYFKGGLVLHTLRYYLGEDAFFAAFRAMAGDDYEAPHHVDACEFVARAESAADTDLWWFFETYLYHADPPELVVERTEEQLTLQWETPADVPFTLPVEVTADGEQHRIEMENETGTLEVNPEAGVTIDPGDWLLATINDRTPTP